MGFRNVIFFAVQILLALTNSSYAGSSGVDILPRRTDSLDLLLTSDVCNGSDYCLVRGGVAKAGWYYPGCTESCGTETWYVKNLPSDVAKISFDPPVTTGSTATTMTLTVAAAAPAGDYKFDLGASCSGSTSCRSISLVLRVVKPTVSIVSQSVLADRISLQLDPPKLSGELVISLSGKPKSYEIVRISKQAGGAVDIPYGVVAGKIAKSSYSKLTATWSVAAEKASAEAVVAFDVLGDFEQTQYHIVKESLCSGNKVPVKAWALVKKAGGGTKCSDTPKKYKSDFKAEVRENGTGITETGVTTQIEGYCASGTQDFRQPAQAATAKCAGGTLGPNTVAAYFGSGLRCGDKLLIVGLPGAVGAVGAIKTVTDACPACKTAPKGRDGHLDNFTQDGRCNGVVGLGHRFTIRLR